MRKMKKLISVSLILAMICLTTACGNDKNQNTNDMAGTTEITVLPATPMHRPAVQPQMTAQPEQLPVKIQSAMT